MAEINVAILGLNRAGASVAMALKRYNARGEGNSFTITGYDTNPDTVREAKKIGVIDIAKHQPDEAVKDQGVVFLSVSYGEVSAIYSLISRHLKTGVVIIDFATLKAQSLAAAEKHLPSNTHLICAAPILNPRHSFSNVDDMTAATEELFDKGSMMLMPSVKSAQEAITLANNLTEILGATPHFFDPHEHDALAAATEALPVLLNIAYFYTLTQNEGWGDTQRLTNPAFGAQSRALFDMHPDDMLDLLWQSKDNLKRHLNLLLRNLTQLRDALDEDDTAAMEAVIDTASSTYQEWVNQRFNNTWDKDRLKVETPTFGDSVSHMFGSFMRFGKKDDEKDKK